jgi:hypothetical protein
VCAHSCCLCTKLTVNLGACALLTLCQAQMSSTSRWLNACAPFYFTLVWCDCQFGRSGPVSLLYSAAVCKLPVWVIVQCGDCTLGCSCPFSLALKALLCGSCFLAVFCPISPLYVSFSSCERTKSFCYLRPVNWRPLVTHCLEVAHCHLLIALVHYCLWVPHHSLSTELRWEGGVKFS